MDGHNYIIIAPERKRGQHLGREERGATQQLKKQEYSLRAIAREINCSPSTVMNELRRGTPQCNSHRGRRNTVSSGDWRYMRPIACGAEDPIYRPLFSLCGMGSRASP